MAAKPASVPRWAQTTGGVVVTGANAPVTPNSGKLDAGFAPGEKPPANYFNWLFNLIYLWTLYVKDAIHVADSGSGLAGVSGTGDGVAAGVSGTGGATNGAGVVGQGTGTGRGVQGTGG